MISLSSFNNFWLTKHKRQWTERNRNDLMSNHGDICPPDTTTSGCSPSRLCREGHWWRMPSRTGLRIRDLQVLKFTKKIDWNIKFQQIAFCLGNLRVYSLNDGHCDLYVLEYMYLLITKCLELKSMWFVLFCVGSLLKNENENKFAFLQWVKQHFKPSRNLVSQSLINENENEFAFSTAN